MASRTESAGAIRPRSRRSIAHVPRSKLIVGADKENATTDIGAMKDSTQTRGKDKKSRSKSLGPGGLDALQDSHGNRRKSTVAPPLKSILKPTVPVSPIRNIPSFEETRRRTPGRGMSPGPKDTDQHGQGSSNAGLLIDFETPPHPPTAATNGLSNPFDGFNASSVIRDGMVAAKEREEEEKSEREKRRILEQREARRKSMANRRVSFAPEATLHTWNVVEIPEDSTASSASNSTRRASSLTTARTPETSHAGQTTELPPSSDAGADSDSAFSPVRHQDLQHLTSKPAPRQQPRELSSSPFSGSSPGSSDGASMHGPAGEDEEEDGDEDEDEEDFESDGGLEGESTAMSMDDLTARSGVTDQSDTSSTTSSARLNEALRQAAKEAGTRGIDYDENEDISMSIVDQEITGAFQPWIKKGERKSFDWDDLSAVHDQENIKYPTLVDSNQLSEEPNVGDENENEDEEMSMDVTNAIGRIITKQLGRKSTGEETSYGDQTMELTNVFGGIAESHSPVKSDGAEDNDDEGMTMEFTTVVGGLINRDSMQSGEVDSVQEEPMEITGAVGGILTSGHTRQNTDDDQTATMDVTTAMGRIMPHGLEAGDKMQAKRLMELESDSGQLASSPFQESVRPSPTRSSARTPSKSPAKSPGSYHRAAVASESGSPSLANVRPRSSRRSSLRGISNVPMPQAGQRSPARRPSTPSKQMTPQMTANRPLTPGKTPPSSNVTFRGASPKKLFQTELQESSGKTQTAGHKSLFDHDAVTGQSTPSIVLRPRSKRSSGVGIDREGLGSPRVAAILDKRRSIGEEAEQFVPQGQPLHVVRFEDPIKLHEEVDREREEEERREDGHTPPVHCSGQDPTSNLKDMISGLTPKKNKLRGRKSLHVGAARGLLGKRPLELDQDEDDDADNSPKRLRGRDASPVKSVKLPAPPTKNETVGRMRRSPRKEPGSSPLKQSMTLNQESISNYTKTSTGESEREASSGQHDLLEGDGRGADQGTEDTFEPIQLQDFLNMTNIHFMELTTTKRRHTTAPGSDRKLRRSSGAGGAQASAASFEDCVAAGFCTVPMLELYQHSCRELKSYISEGRQVIRSIEAETHAENPALFREYATAPSDIRLLMDNQFRNVKSHARLLSKATWYEWRMKLLEGLKEGLDRHVEEMQADGEYLTRHEEILNAVVPSLVEQHAALEEEASSLQQLADEMEKCDKDELRSARKKLLSAEAEIVLKKRQLAEMQAAIQDKTDIIEAGTGLKAEIADQIQEAERVKEECRGWSAKEVYDLKASLQNLERRLGWSIIAAIPSPDSPFGPALTVCYRDQLHLTFHPAAYASEMGSSSHSDEAVQRNRKSPMELAYRPRSTDRPAAVPAKLSPIGSLILRSLQSHLGSIQQSTTTPQQILQFISQAWDLAMTLEEETRLLQFCGVTNLKLVSSGGDQPPSLRARCTLLGALKSKSKPSQKTPTRASSKKPKADSGNTRVDVDFAIRTRIVNTNGSSTLARGIVGTLHLDTEVIASTVYGFGIAAANDTAAAADIISETEMRDLLRRELGEKKQSGLQLGQGVWCKTVETLSATIF